MPLTKISTDGVKDDAITKAKIPADQIEASELANNAVDTNAIQDEAVTLAKLPHGNSNNDGKFLRANNGADPSYEAIAQPDLTNLSASNLTSGTVPDARFPATLPAASAANLTNIPAANITGTLPAISGANLTNLPVQASISSHGNNRLITSGGGSNLIGQQHLTFDGSHLILGSGKGIRTNYIRHCDGSSTNTGGASQQYWKIGDITLNGSEGAVITLMGANGYSSGGSNFAGETTIVLRGGNANTLIGFWYSNAGVGIATYSDVRWKHSSGVTYELWVSAGNFNNIAPIVKTTGTFDNTNAAGTGSNTAPSGSTALPSTYVKKVGSIDTIEYQSTGTIFKRNIVMDSGYGIDFSATSNASGMSSEVLDDYEEGTYTPVIRGHQGWNAAHNQQHGNYVKIGSMCYVHIYIQTANMNSISGSSYLECSLPFTSSNFLTNRTVGTLMCSEWSISSQNISWMGGDVQSASQYVRMHYHNGSNNNTNQMTKGNLGNSLHFRGTVVYRVP